MTTPVPAVVLEREPRADWDARAVDVPGGHALQSRAWATYRASRGNEPRYAETDDGAATLVLLRRAAGLPWVDAIIRRGPAHRDEAATTAVARVRAIAGAVGGERAIDLWLDPERDADPAWARAMDAAGFAIAEEREPSIHVMRRTFDPAEDEASLWSGLTKSARQRVTAARRAGTTVEADADGVALEPFVVLLRQRASALGIALAADDGFIAGWRALLRAGHARFLAARHDGDLVGGLFLYRHGGIHATAFSADDEARRRDLPGTMHLVRWQAIVDALADGARSIDLGGVDLPGARTKPEPGDPTRGLYEHKRSFGAVWVDREPARRIVLRPWADRIARLRRRSIDAVRRMRR